MQPREYALIYDSLSTLRNKYTFLYLYFLVARPLPGGTATKIELFLWLPLLILVSQIRLPLFRSIRKIENENI